MYAELNCSFKEIVVVDGDEQLRDVDVHLVRDDVCNVMEHTYAVDAGKSDGGGEGVLLVHVPLYVENAVAIACLQLVGNGTVAFMYDDMVVSVDETEGIVARDDLTALCEDELRDVLVGNIDGLLAVEVLAYYDVVGFLACSVLLLSEERHKIFP